MLLTLPEGGSFPRLQSGYALVYLGLALTLAGSGACFVFEKLLKTFFFNYCGLRAKKPIYSAYFTKSMFYAGSVGDAGNTAEVNAAQVKGSSLSTEQPVCQVLSMIWPQETNSLDNSGRKPPLARSLHGPASSQLPLCLRSICATGGDPTHCGGRTPTLCLSLPPFLDTRPFRHSADTSHLTLTPDRCSHPK